jgi:hypothetical protein
MSHQTRTALDLAAEEVHELADRLITLGEKLDRLVVQADEAAWLAAARRELEALIERIERP